LIFLLHERTVDMSNQHIYEQTIRRCVVCMTTRPTYNYPGEKPAKYCKEHKLPGMVDVKSRKCMENVNSASFSARKQ
jgi:hypothetical protein